MFFFPDFKWFLTRWWLFVWISNPDNLQTNLFLPKQSWTHRNFRSTLGIVHQTPADIQNQIEINNLLTLKWVPQLSGLSCQIKIVVGETRVQIPVKACAFFDMANLVEVILLASTHSNNVTYNYDHGPIGLKHSQMNDDGNLFL